MTGLHQQLLDIATDNEQYGDIPAARALGAALRVVVELHAPDGDGRCRSCYHNVGATGRVSLRRSHPCPTVRAIARELGIETSEPR